MDECDLRVGQHLLYRFLEASASVHERSAEDAAIAGVGAQHSGCSTQLGGKAVAVRATARGGVDEDRADLVVSGQIYPALLGPPSHRRVGDQRDLLARLARSQAAPERTASILFHNEKRLMSQIVATAEDIEYMSLDRPNFKRGGGGGHALIIVDPGK